MGLRIVYVLLLIGIGAPAGAQTAQLSGRITDSSSAVVSGAAVTVIAIETGIRRPFTSNDEGYYSAPFLSPGTYRLIVEHAGFKQVRVDGITLAVDQSARVDVVLEPGEFHEEVRVEGGAPLIDKESSATSQLIDNRTIVTLPLNGRNYAQLALLAPGAVPSPKGADAFHVNGNRGFQNSFLIDGLDNNYSLFGGATVTHAIRPSIDAIQEFKVETANYSAQYGRGTGGVISLAVKSGTNTFHGSGFEFFRHEVFEATDFFAKRAGLRPPPLRYHQFGGTLGGPLVRNRAFFFVSYQGTRERRTSPEAATVPMPGMIQGRFGNVPIYDPLDVVNGVRQPFFDHTIPSQRIDPVGQRLAALYPAPNQPGAVNNFVGNVKRTDDEDQIDVRLDAHLSGRAHVFGRYSLASGQSVQESLFGPPGHGDPGALIGPRRASSISFGETHMFTGTVVNEFRAGYLTNAAGRHPPATRPLFDEFGLRGISVVEGLTGLPTLTVVGFGSLGDRGGPARPRSRVVHVSDHLSWARGEHTLKLGGELRLRTNVARQSQAARGMLTFTGQFTAQDPRRGGGSAVADLLLGQTSNAQLTTVLEGEFHDRYFGAYVDDTWRLSSRLTLNLGLRYDLQTPMWERDNRMSNFDLDPRSPTLGTLVPARAGDLRSRSFVDLDTNNLAPRVGLVYQIDSKSVLRGAFGTFYSGFGYLAAAYTGAANFPHFSRVQFRSATDAATSTLVLADGFPANALDPGNVRNPAAVGWTSEFPVGQVHQWSLGAEHALSRTTVLSLTYVGSDSAHLRGYNTANSPGPGPGPLAARRPFPLFEDITYVAPFVEATYHALQTKAERRFRGGLGLLVSHTWSHAIDNSSDHGDVEGDAPSTWPQNPADVEAERASASFDVRHRLVASSVYDLPLGRPDALLGRSRVFRALLGGWQLAGILVAQTGFPMTPALRTSPANTTTPARPDCLRDGNLPRGQRTVDRWFDAAAFAPATPYTYGNCGRHVLRAPGLMNLDLLITRNFELKGGKRLEFRGEIFNAANAVHLGRPNLLIDLPDQAGRITSTQAPARQLQLGLRFVF
jgi:carboxypeptidase family protein/TonB-dependent receptor-like protein